MSRIDLGNFQVGALRVVPFCQFLFLSAVAARSKMDSGCSDPRSWRRRTRSRAPYQSQVICNVNKT